MNRRSFFQSLLGAALAPAVAPIVAKALPVGAITESRRFNSDGTMSFYRDEVVPCVTTVECPIQFTKFAEADFVYTIEELSLEEFRNRFPYDESAGYWHGKECRNFHHIDRELFF
jgi:hypothetical protein